MPPTAHPASVRARTQTQEPGCTHTTGQGVSRKEGCLGLLIFLVIGPACFSASLGLSLFIRQVGEKLTCEEPTAFEMMGVGRRQLSLCPARLDVFSPLTTTSLHPGPAHSPFSSLTCLCLAWIRTKVSSVPHGDGAGETARPPSPHSLLMPSSSAQAPPPHEHVTIPIAAIPDEPTGLSQRESDAPVLMTRGPHAYDR